MDGINRISTGDRPAFLARLEGTLPHTDGRATAVASADPGVRIERTSSPRLHQKKFTSSSSVVPNMERSTQMRESFSPIQNTEREKKRSRAQLALDLLGAHRWLIAALIVAGGLAGYLYSTELCVPLFRVQATIELQDVRIDSSAETLARVLTSQSMIASALSALPEAERDQLVETPRVRLTGPSTAIERLRERVKAVAIPSAQVIDLDVISPNREAAVNFLNSLIHGLIQRNQDEKQAASVQLPDEARSLQGHAVDNITIIDPAIPMADPVGPNVAGNILLGLLGGTLAGVLFALIRQFATKTFSGPGSVGQVLGVRELGAIPERKLLAAPGGDGDLSATQLDANDESLRYLRSSLLYHPGRQEIRSLAFTSAAPGEGKTTVVTNLSMSLAATGRRVLVIDGDLRRPRLHKLLQVAQGPGLSDLLRRDPVGPPAILSKYVAPTSFQNLYILPPGTGGGDAPELLAGPFLAKLVSDLGKSFDFVLIDTPPLLACADARNYARAVEGVVLVVRSSETQKRAALVARDMLLEDGATIIGTVLTGWRQTDPTYNYPSMTNYART